MLYEDQVAERLREAAGGDTSDIEADEYGRVSLSSLGLNTGPRVAVIHASGVITGGKGGFDPLNGEALGSDLLLRIASVWTYDARFGGKVAGVGALRKRPPSGPWTEPIPGRMLTSLLDPSGSFPAPIWPV